MFCMNTCLFDPFQDLQRPFEHEVRGSFQALTRPNADIARGVDTRQELDLRVGVAFSRLLTRSLRKTPVASGRQGQKASITWLRP